MDAPEALDVLLISRTNRGRGCLSGCPGELPQHRSLSRASHEPEQLPAASKSSGGIRQSSERSLDALAAMETMVACCRGGVVRVSKRIAERVRALV